MAGASEPVADPITAERVALMGESANTLARLGSAVACDPDNRLGIVKRARSLDLSGQLPRSDVHQVIEHLFAGVAEGRMTQIVRKAYRLG